MLLLALLLLSLWLIACVDRSVELDPPSTATRRYSRVRIRAGPLRVCQASFVSTKKGPPAKGAGVVPIPA